MIEIIWIGGICVVDPKSVTPAYSEPGTGNQQLAIIDGYLCDPSRRLDWRRAWEGARQLNLPHAAAAAWREAERMASA